MTGRFWKVNQADLNSLVTSALIVEIAMLICSRRSSRRSSRSVPVDEILIGRGNLPKKAGAFQEFVHFGSTIRVGDENLSRMFLKRSLDIRQNLCHNWFIERIIKVKNLMLFRNLIGGSIRLNQL